MAPLTILWEVPNVRESEKMEIKKLYEEGVSISELSRRFGHDRKTIRKALREQTQEQAGVEKPSRGRKVKGYKLEPFKAYC
jgi:transposase-like protein